MPASSRLRAEQLSLAYGPVRAVRELTLEVPDGQITSIIGPNGCGKSTLLRGLARLLKPDSGSVLLDSRAINQQPTKAVARQLGLLPQQSALPDSVTVEDLVRRGRYPHQAPFQAPTKLDAQMVDHAIELAGVGDLRQRAVDELSGGQRQRAWIAMALAQDTPILLLDEPTTYLDIAHQHEVLSLLERLNHEEQRTIVLVLHDMNDAASISDYIVAMANGVIMADGPPSDVLTPSILEEVFGVQCDVVRHPLSGLPVSVPRGRPMPEPRAAPSAPGPRAERLTTGYGERIVLHDVDVSFPPGQVSTIIGPNACGKSTLLRTVARLVPVRDGAVWLGDQRVQTGSRRTFAQRLGMLSQGALAPPGVLVEDLVASGRFPYQRWYRQWSARDGDAVEAAISAADLGDLRLRPVDTLSGGQMQRVWFALALAQATPVLLLDEPITFLDIAHQVEVLDLVRELNVREGRTVIMVLHDLGLAARYADYVVAMQAGRVVAAGPPTEVVTEALVRDVFGLETRVVADPRTGRPLVLPIATVDQSSSAPLSC